MADITVRLLGDTSNLKRAFADVEGNAGRFQVSFGNIMRKVATSIGAAFAAREIFQFGQDAVNAASSLEETMNKVNVVLGDASDEVLAWSQNSSQAFGQSRRQALDAASTFAIFGKSANLSGGDLADFSTGLTELSADFASFFNTSPEDAITAIGAALRGEQEPIRRYGVLLNEATLRNRALAMGIVTTTTQALTPQQRVLAAHAEILAQSSDAQGDFARTSGGLANQQRSLNAEFENLKAEIGTALLPVMLELAKFVNETLIPAFRSVHEWVKENWPEIKQTITDAVQEIKDFVEPIVKALELLWKNFGDNVVEFTRRAWDPIKQHIQGVLQTIHATFQFFAALFSGDWSGAWNAIKDVVAGVWNSIVGIVRTQLEIVRATLGVGLELVKGVFSGTWDAITDGAEQALIKLVGFFIRLPGRISDALGLLGMMATRPFKLAWNAIADLWNDSIGQFSFSIPGWVPGLGGHGFDMPDMPKLAHGGIVTRPTVAMIGEGARDEAVIPLPPGWRNGAGTGGERQPIIVEIDGRVLVDTVIDFSHRTGGVPIRIRAAS